MKFHKVKVENLNSLYGVQTIDFEEDVRGASLFLIVGPTGAGKSTILDAICLALFGQTPRLEKRVGRADTDVAHIMSIGTSSAYAEVEFSTLEADGSRSRYLATWSARRAYDDPEGAVQRPERSLYRKFVDGTMKLVVSDHREKYFQPGFDKALRGLSVDDFKRSILLAQGEFSAFLHASDRDKASILERLTNTDNYRRIGDRASRRRREVDDRHRKLMTRLEEMQVLTLPQEQELAEAIATTTAQLSQAEAAAKSASQKVTWLQALEDLEERVEGAEEALENAQKALSERDNDQRKLARDAELLEVEPDWREVERTQQVIVTTTEQLVPLTKRLTDLETAENEAAKQIETAQTAVDNATKAAKTADPQIRKSHELRTRRDEATKHAVAAGDILAKKAATVANLDQELSVARPAAEKAEAALAAALKQVEALESARPLLDQFGAIRSNFANGIEPLRQRADELRGQVNELAERQAEIASQRAAFDADLAAARKERGKWQAQVTKAQNKLDATLPHGSKLNDAVNELTAKLNAANTRAEALREARYLLGRIQEQQQERETLDKRLREAQKEVEELAKEEQQVKELETAHREHLRACNDALRQNERVIALSAYRRDLETGNPCPLCGSPLHPYCESMELADLDAQAAADRERLEATQEKARQSLRATNERVQLLAGKFVARKTSLAKDESRAFAIRTSLEEDQSAFSRSAENAGYAPLEAFRLKNEELLRTDLADATQLATSSRTQLDEIEQARQQLANAQSKQDTADAALAEVTQQTEQLDEANRQLADRIETRKADITKTDAELDARGAALLAELAELGVKPDANASLEDALALAELRRKTLLDADNAAKAAEQSLTTSQQTVARLTERRETAAREHDEATKTAEAAAAAVTKLDGEIGELFDGRDPAEVKREFDAALEAAREKLETAAKARAAHKEALSASRARRDELNKQIEQAQKSHQRADQKLEQTLQQLEIGRGEVEANLLSTADRKRLRAEIDKLSAAQTRAKDRCDDLRKRLTEHTEKPLATPEESLTDAAADHDAARAILNDVTLALGGLRERWAKHEETKSRRSEIEGELKEVQHDVDVWSTIYGLIGIRDGESFKLFAQSLNLQGLVDNANARLQKLHARYELTVARGEAGEPTLSFMVRDRYQANVERPLTTLSGGETFLVSLALALGLADFRRIDMPIETLLLDEGFGSLDQDSLHMALTTLHQLHRDASRQIGIISHVDALKELIDARIVVEPRGHGRSALRFEFGAGKPGTQLEIITL